jgi:hypothetical protein
VVPKWQCASWRFQILMHRRPLLDHFLISVHQLLNAESFFDSRLVKVSPAAALRDESFLEEGISPEISSGTEIKRQG